MEKFDQYYILIYGLPYCTLSGNNQFHDTCKLLLATRRILEGLGEPSQLGCATGLVRDTNVTSQDEVESEK
ncbi:hypothetical protein FRC02_003031, partial [Tulasnella sp. 418]